MGHLFQALRPPWHIDTPGTSEGHRLQAETKQAKERQLLAPVCGGGVLLMKRGVFFYEMVRHSKNWD